MTVMTVSPNPRFTSWAVVLVSASSGSMSALAPLWLAVAVTVMEERLVVAVKLVVVKLVVAVSALNTGSKVIPPLSDSADSVASAPVSVASILWLLSDEDGGEACSISASRPVATPTIVWSSWPGTSVRVGGSGGCCDWDVR